MKHYLILDLGIVGASYFSLNSFQLMGIKSVTKIETVLVEKLFHMNENVTCRELTGFGQRFHNV